MRYFKATVYLSLDLWVYQQSEGALGFQRYERVTN